MSESARSKRGGKRQLIPWGSYIHGRPLRSMSFVEPKGAEQENDDSDSSCSACSSPDISDGRRELPPQYLEGLNGDKPNLSNSFKALSDTRINPVDLLETAPGPELSISRPSFSWHPIHPNAPKTFLAIKKQQGSLENWPWNEGAGIFAKDKEDKKKKLSIKILDVNESTQLAGAVKKLKKCSFVKIGEDNQLFTGANIASQICGWDVVIINTKGSLVKGLDTGRNLSDLAIRTFINTLVSPWQFLRDLDSTAYLKRFNNTMDYYRQMNNLTPGEISNGAKNCKKPPKIVITVASKQVDPKNVKYSTTDAFHDMGVDTVYASDKQLFDDINGYFLKILVEHLAQRCKTNKGLDLEDVHEAVAKAKKSAKYEQSGNPQKQQKGFGNSTPTGETVDRYDK